MVQPTIHSPSARVYLEFDVPTDIPAKEDGWTRFVCLSDTHSEVHWDRGGRMPRGDVLLHAGDLSSWGKVRNLRKTIDWLGELDGYRSKIIIAGNHDLWLDDKSEDLNKFEDLERTKMLNECQEMMAEPRLKEKGLIYLQYEETKSKAGEKEWAVYGSPASPRHSEGSFQYETKKEAEEIHARIPCHTEILLTHTPPYGLEKLDKTRKGKHVGCKSLAARLDSGDLPRCRLHVFGHIHEAVGAVIIPATAGRAVERVAVNAAIRHRGKPIVVDLKNEC